MTDFLDAALAVVVLVACVAGVIFGAVVIYVGRRW